MIKWLTLSFINLNRCLADKFVAFYITLHHLTTKELFVLYCCWIIILSGQHYCPVKNSSMTYCRLPEIKRFFMYLYFLLLLIIPPMKMKFPSFKKGKNDFIAVLSMDDARIFSLWFQIF